MATGDYRPNPCPLCGHLPGLTFHPVPDAPALVPGITLRDWFAGQALTGFVSADAHNPEFEDYARRAYAAADAMLAEREKEEPDA